MYYLFAFKVALLKVVCSLKEKPHIKKYNACILYIQKTWTDLDYTYDLCLTLYFPGVSYHLELHTPAGAFTNIALTSQTKFLRTKKSFSLTFYIANQDIKSSELSKEALTHLFW